jgi:hypothetical protein
VRWCRSQRRRRQSLSLHGLGEMRSAEESKKFNHLASAERVARWFSAALASDDVKPSKKACDLLARDFQIAINRANNARKQLDRKERVPIGDLKDVSPADLEKEKVGAFLADAGHLLFRAEELEDFYGGYHWPDSQGGVSLDDIKQLLWRIGAFPKERVAAVPKRGRRQEEWHGAARPIARLIKGALQAIGHAKNLSFVDENSLVAIVGAEVISWSYHIKISAAGFAAANRQRDRSRAGQQSDYATCFPGAARLRIT